MVLCSILFGLMIQLGIMACIVPGVFLLLMYFLYAHVLVDENPPGIECFSRAKELSNGNWGSIFIVFLMGCGCSMLGLMACYVGIIFVIPFIHLLWAVAYDRMTRQSPMGANLDK